MVEAFETLATAPKRKAKSLKPDEGLQVWSFMCFPADTMCCFQEEELRADELRAAGLLSTGEDVSPEDASLETRRIFHDGVNVEEGDAETGDDFRLKEQLSPALRKEVQQIKADLAARDAESIVEETDGPCEARAPPRTSADRGKGASGRVTEAPEVEVPAERPLAFEVGHGHFAFAPPPEDRFQGFQEVGTLREEELRADELRAAGLLSTGEDVSPEDASLETRRIFHDGVNVEDTASLEDREVQRILDEAEEKWNEDEEAKFQLELRYAAANLLEQTDLNLVELGYKAPTDARLALEPKMEEVKVCLAEAEAEEQDYFKLMDAVDSLRFELMKLGLRVYGKQVAPDGAPGPAKPRREGGVTGGGYILKEDSEPYDDSYQKQQEEKWKNLRKKAEKMYGRN